jgi:hypothetical protein
LTPGSSSAESPPQRRGFLDIIHHWISCQPWLIERRSRYFLLEPHPLENLKNKKNKKKNNNKNTRVIGVWDFSLPVVPHPKVTACWSVKAC